MHSILGDLEAWGQGKAPDGFVFPLVLESTDDLAAYRAALEDGIPPLRERLDSLQAEQIDEGELSFAETVSLALALLIQGYHHGREFRAHARQIPRGPFRTMRHSYRLLKSVSAAASRADEDQDWAALTRALTECRRTLKPIIAERLRAAKEKAEARKLARNRSESNPDGDSVDSVTLGSQTMEDLSDGKLDALFEETVDTELMKDVEDDSQETPPAGGGKVASRRDTGSSAVDQAAQQRPRRSLTRVGIVIILILLVVGAVTLGPKLIARTPPSETYEEIIPLKGLIRPRYEPQELVAILQEPWDDLSESQRSQIVGELYEAAHELEQITSLTVRDPGGGDLAYAVDGEVTLVGR